MAAELMKLSSCSFEFFTFILQSFISTNVFQKTIYPTRRSQTRQNHDKTRVLSNFSPDFLCHFFAEPL